MRFILVHKTVTYLMVLTSTLSILTSGELSPLTIVLFLLAVAGSWFWEPPRVDYKRFDLPWTLSTVLFLVAVVVRSSGTETLLSSGIGFLLFLVVNKLYNRRASRDYLQLYVLSFMELVAGSTVDVDVTYGLQFILYIVFGTWTLILFHLKREMEDNFLLKYGDSLQGRPVQVERVLNSRKLVGGRFLLATSAISLLVFLGATLVFVLFPRVGFGLFITKQRPGILMTGFGDKVELGQFGTIRDDPTVVMRVELPDLPPGEHPTGYWRGVAFDHYNGKEWTQSRRRQLPVSRLDSGFFAIDNRPGQGPALKQNVYLEPMQTHVLFGLTHVAAVILPDAAEGQGLPGQQRTIAMDLEGDITYSQADDVAFRYTVLSTMDAADPALWHLDLATYRAQLAAERHAARYLELPDDLDPEVAALGRRLVGDATTVGEAVERVERHLRTAYAYSLTLERDTRRAPLEDFLFEQKKGHCEYFATALAILLRTQGIATRNVNGFLGGTWNSFGNYLAITQGEAHSWVEVWLPGGRWATRDATPAGPPRAVSDSFLTHMSMYADALRLRWYKYVIEYDLARQIVMFNSARDALRRLFGGPDEDESGARSGDRSGGLSLPLRTLAAVVGAVGVALVLVFWWRGRGRNGRGRAMRRPGDAVAEAYTRLQDAYARLGFTRPEQATAREYLAQLARQSAPALPLAERTVALYEAARFGAMETPAAELRALIAEIEGLRRLPRG